MELLVGAQKEAHVRGQPPLRLGQEVEVQRGRRQLLRRLDGAGDEGAPGPVVAAARLVVHDDGVTEQVVTALVAEHEFADQLFQHDR